MEPAIRAASTVHAIRLRTPGPPGTWIGKERPFVGKRRKANT